MSRGGGWGLWSAGSSEVMKCIVQSRNTEQGALSVLKDRGVSVPFQFAGCVPEWSVSISARAVGDGRPRVSSGSQGAGTISLTPTVCPAWLHQGF